MKGEKRETKICKYCKTEIPTGAKVCPNCRKKQGGKLKWIFLAIIVICIAATAMGGGEDGGNGKARTVSEKKKITYKKYHVNEMVKDLEENAANASDKYKGKYLQITGKLENIDSDMAYITLGSNNTISLTFVQCYIKDEAQEEAVKKMSKGDRVTLKGKCTDVGEVMGYALDIDKIR
jgi:RNA polymerase subunit RPABC4/transcription elongation factor Spt4